MKKIVSFFVLTFSIATPLYFGYQKFFVGPCDSPIRYRIGRFDNDFNIDVNTFKKEINSAESIWEKIANKNLFEYDENAKFTVNLVYDDRQATTDLKERTEFGLTDIENLFQKANNSFESQKKIYEDMVSEYNADIKSFDIRKMLYEEEVRKWNNKGGAPEGVFSKLEAEREALNKLAIDINTRTLAINKMADEINLLLKNRNDVADRYNKIVKEYNKKFGHGIEFNQAEYSSASDSINIYQFTSVYDLRLALAHELGHSLGFEHIENFKSIMYFRTQENSNVYENIEATNEDIAELRRVCQF